MPPAAAAPRRAAATPRPRVRVARLPDDAERLAHADFRAFREGAPEGWVAYYRENPHLRHEHGVLVVEEEGEIAAQAALLRFDLALGGADAPIFGLAAVGTAPEARRRGLADLLMREALLRARRARAPLALLYPFSERYYRRFGYESVELCDHLRVSPRQLAASPLRRHVRPLRPQRDGAAVEALYERWRAGRVGPLGRSSWWWETRVWKRAVEWFVYRDPQRGQVTGYLGYDVPQSVAYPRQEVVVRELVATTADAFAGLVGFLEALGDQVVVVDLSLPRGAALPILIEHGRHPESRIRAHLGHHAEIGAMARLVDVPAALALHPGPARAAVRGRIGLDVDDPIFADHRALDLEITPRGIRAVRGHAARDRLALSVQRLAQIYFAAAPATLLLAEGLITGSPRAAALLDQALAGPPMHLGAGNYF